MKKEGRLTEHAPKDMDDRYNKISLKDQHQAIKKLEVFFRNVTQNVTFAENAKK